jgi:hypothetical protein
VPFLPRDRRSRHRSCTGGLSTLLLQPWIKLSSLLAVRACTFSKSIGFAHSLTRGTLGLGDTLLSFGPFPPSRCRLLLRSGPFSFGPRGMMLRFEQVLLGLLPLALRASATKSRHHERENNQHDHDNHNEHDQPRWHVDLHGELMQRTGTIPSSHP